MIYYWKNENNTFKDIRYFCISLNKYILKRYDENADDKYAINLYPDRM